MFNWLVCFFTGHKPKKYEGLCMTYKRCERCGKDLRKRPPFPDPVALCHLQEEARYESQTIDLRIRLASPEQLADMLPLWRVTRPQGPVEDFDYDKHL